MRTILLVEDDANDVFFFQRAMKKGAFINPIQVASDGQEAIDYLKGAGKFADREVYPLPGLVLLDLKLPFVMGLDVLKWIRQESGLSLVVLLLTASSDDADIGAAYRLGANGFLIKPSDFGQLQEMVKAIHHFWLMHNTVPGELRKEPTGAPARSFQIDPGATIVPARCQQKWHPTIVKRNYQNRGSVGL
jgi:DNA-binding response OmpR family regulator